MSLMYIPRLGKGTRNTYIQIGLLWITATVLFEFGMGFFIEESFSNMLKAYDITTGNLWTIVILFIGFAPWLTAKVKQFI